MEYITALNDLCKETEKIIRERTQSSKSCYKTLLLGCGHAGKSTIWKQLIQIYGGGFIDEEYTQSAGKHIQDSIIVQMKNILHTFRNPNNGEFAATLDDELVSAANKVSNISPEKAISDVEAEIIELWSHSTIKNAFNTRNNLGIADSSGRFFDDMVRICSTTYRPTDDDILLASIPTTGLRDKKIDINGQIINLFDTGGQRSERNKWIHCFDSVHCMIYVASLSHFNLFLYEENEINAMIEQIECFECLVNSRHFKHAKIVLILNFIDMFKDKIMNQNKSISHCFNDYDDDYKSIETDNNCKQEWQRSLEFIQNKFQSKMPDNQELYIHVICALQQNDVKKAFDDIGHLLQTSFVSTTFKNVVIEESYTYNQRDAVNEIKVHFIINILIYIVVAIVLVYVPFYALSYLQMSISAILFIIIVGVSISMIADEYDNERLSIKLLKNKDIRVGILVLIIGCMMAILNAIQVSYFKLENDTRDDWKWIVYIFFPISLFILYFILISYTTYYFFWHQLFMTFWFGLMLLIIGLSNDFGVYYINEFLWIFGVCLMVISFMLPFCGYYYLKSKKDRSVYHRLKSLNVL